MACGYRRHTNRLALLGYNVTRLDINEKSLSMVWEGGKGKFLLAKGRIYNKRIVVRDGKIKEKPFFISVYTVVLLLFTLIG
jgi:hypothetical protein